MSTETVRNISARPSNVFTNRNFSLLFSGKIISQLGDQIYAFALSWYILDLTKSSLQMAVFLVIDTLAVTVISPFGGIIADRLNRKKILVIMDIMRGLLVSGTAALLYFHMLQIWMLYISAFALGFCGSVFSPAAGAIIPDIVSREQISGATSASQFATNFCTMLGMLVSGVLYSLIGIFAIFAVNAASYVISAVLEACLNIPCRGNKEQKNVSGLKKVLAEFRDGCRYVRGNKPVYYLLLTNTLFNFVALPLGLVYTSYFFNVLLKAAPIQLSLPQSSVWIGMLVGTLIASKMLKKYGFKKLLFRGLLLVSLSTLLAIPWFVPQIRDCFSIWEISALWTVMNLVCGLAVNFFTVAIYVLFQKRTTDEYRGRFWGLENSLRTLAMCGGYFLAGFLAQTIWLGYCFSGAAVILLLVSARIRNFKGLEEAGCPRG